MSALPADQYRPAAGGLGPYHGLVHQQGKSGGEQMATAQGSPSPGAQSLQSPMTAKLCAPSCCTWGHLQSLIHGKVIRI